MSYKYYYWIFITMLFSQITIAAISLGDINKFIERPDEQSYLKLKADLLNKGGLNDFSDDARSYKTLSKLFSLIKKNNVYAVRFGFTCTSKVEGGALGELYEALSTTVIVNPVLFLQEIKRQKIPYYIHKKILYKVPYVMTENYKAQLELINRKITAFKSIKDKRLLNERNLSLEILNNKLKNIQAMLKLIQNL